MSNFIDSNLILRFILDDPGAEKTERLLRGKKKLILADVTVAEIVWVLDSFYKWEREKIAEALTGLANVKSVSTDRELISITLDIFKKYNVDYVDAYLAASVIRDGSGEIYSMDRDFDKIPGLKRVEPK
jgi:predicted nucleic acid-binding protein